ncbi:hypothetical protein TWF102_004049 [Orbilia oligospora]|uniref:Uncharacterized protein n=1 Tax=Orbilia oligospora TaxID=2813651 RepID=A0A7C8N1G5_ORBOL|nr:hypothetical protein TWF102_004049 [Orbilia oligospora]
MQRFNKQNKCRRQQRKEKFKDKNSNNEAKESEVANQSVKPEDENEESKAKLMKRAWKNNQQKFKKVAKIGKLKVESFDDAGDEVDE